jgi:hypothetical protein
MEVANFQLTHKGFDHRAFGQFPRYWAEAPIQNRRPRRCGKRPREGILPSRLTRRKLRREIMGLAYRLGHLCPFSLTSEASPAPCLQGCSAVAWSRGSRGADAMSRVSTVLCTARLPHAHRDDLEGARWETGHGEGQRWCAVFWAPPWDAVMAVEGRNRHARESGGGAPL